MYSDSSLVRLMDIGWVVRYFSGRWVYVCAVTGALLTIWNRESGHTACLGLYGCGYGVSESKAMYFSYKAVIRYEVHTVLYKAVFNVSSVIPKQNVKQTVKKLWMSASKESYSGYHIMLIYTIGQSKVGQSRRRWLSQRRT